MARIEAYETEWTTDTYNAMLCFRVIAKHMIMKHSSSQIRDLFEADRFSSSPLHASFAIDPIVVADKRSRTDQLIEEIMQLIIYANVKTQLSHDVYFESLNLILVLFSTQLKCEGSDFFIEVVMRNSHFARGVITRLLDNFVKLPSVPNVPTTGVLSNAYSLLFSTPKKLEEYKSYTIPSYSILLLLTLTNQNETKSSQNLFRVVLSHFEDGETVLYADEDLIPDPENQNISFSLIYKQLCLNVGFEEITLLLYTLMIQNPGFRTYVLSRSDPEALLIPILRSLYETCTDCRNGFNQPYILLSILLLLSHDDGYSENIEKVIIPPQPWYTERILKSVTLGGLLVLVIFRTIQINLSQHKDTYIHTITIAILTNISIGITDIHPIIAQRIVSLFEHFAKRYFKLFEEKDLDLSVEFEIYGDLIVLLLELINSIILNLRNNTQMVYALLHRRELFMKFRIFNELSPLIENIDIVISYFHPKLQDQEFKLLSAEKVLEIIEQAAKTFGNTRLLSLKRVVFKYEQEGEQLDFFLPFVWSTSKLPA
ncbi:hypothetical protein HK098_005414 [Nowakowskiella sp. JEL0407]|nr:hypothetical protein HK098_005414 [Nowakowskiella sp. JEL0407]